MVLGGGECDSAILARRIISPSRYPDQRLTRAQALKGMTLDAAYASFAEHELGSLTPGKKGEPSPSPLSTHLSLSSGFRHTGSRHYDCAFL
jgi:hypothetical protein